MKPFQIPVFRPLIESEEVDASREALECGWLGMGSYVGKFEGRLVEYLGSPDRHVVDSVRSFFAK